MADETTVQNEVEKTEEAPVFDPSLKKKKRKGGRTGRRAGRSSTKEEHSSATENEDDKSPGDIYAYDDLLSRAFELIGTAKSKTSKVKVPPPEAFGVGSRKTLWSNFPQTAKTSALPSPSPFLSVWPFVGTCTSLTLPVEFREIPVM